ncbi:MAG: rRNA maturation RNase YbeY [Azospirillum sp.]|nr:rRNA maturation RNase YbeY [Azospirillum sp.]
MTRVEIIVTAAAAGWDGEAAKLAEAAAATVLSGLLPRPCGPLELGITLADDATVRDLNHRYRGRDKPTNVLSFPLMAAPLDELAGDPDSAQPAMLGDVVLARQTILCEAEEQGKEVPAHLAHLVVHGVLHLLGFDHESDGEADQMEALEIRFLAELGVDDPYGDRGDARDEGGPAAPPRTPAGA